MDGNEYLNIIQANKMTNVELMIEIKKLYDDNWAISKQCETLEIMLNERFKKEVNYEKEFAREKIVRQYANSNNYEHNIYTDRQEIDEDGNETRIFFTERNYLPVDNDRTIAEIQADWDLLPKYRKIMAYIGSWFDDCVSYLRGIWGITN